MMLLRAFVMAISMLLLVTFGRAYIVPPHQQQQRHTAFPTTTTRTTTTKKTTQRRGSLLFFATTTRRAWLCQTVATTTSSSALFDTSGNSISQQKNDTLLTTANRLQKKSLRQVLQVDDDNSNAITSPFPAVVGHRGCLYDALENTREGFQKCMAMGCDAVELDVFALKCGTLVVYHGSGTDENPGLLNEYFETGSYPNDRNAILDYTYDELLTQDWKFNVDNPEFPCPKESILRGSIPTLEQVLQDVRGDTTSSSNNMHVTMELKGGYNLPERVLQLVDDMDMVHQTSCSSFNLQYLAEVRALRPQRDHRSGHYKYRTGALFNDVNNDDAHNKLLSHARDVQADEIHLRYDTCTTPLIKEIHRQGFGSMAWFRGPVGMDYDSRVKYTIGNEGESAMYSVVAQTGIQRMCVNRPAVLLSLREKLKKQGERLSSSSSIAA